MMQRSKTFRAFHLVHSSVLSQSHAPQKFHDVGTDPKAPPILAYLLENNVLYVLGGAVGVTKLLHFVAGPS
jgi:hypothetical protein